MHQLDVLTDALLTGDRQMLFFQPSETLLLTYTPKPKRIKKKEQDDTTFWLRRDLKVRMQLPVDLTAHEAERLTRFIQTLVM